MTYKILAATDGSKTADRALALAIELAKGLSARLCFVHVLTNERPGKGLRDYADIEHLVEPARQPSAAFPTPQGERSAGYWEGLAPYEPGSSGEEWLSVAAAENILAGAVEHAHAAGVEEVDSTTLEGEPAKAIVSEAAARECDMIVLGSRGLGALRGMLQGSVSQKVMHHASCTVVVVR